MKKILRNVQKKLLELSEFSKVIGYKVNIWKLVILQYNSNAHVQTKIKNSVPHVMTQKKCLDKNLTKYV